MTIPCLALWFTAALTAWDRIEEVQKKIESFTKIKGPKETFTDFFQRLASIVNRMIPNSKTTQIIECLNFENANSQCKRVIRPFKTRSTRLEEWI